MGRSKRRGESQYISWILLFGLVVALSYLLYNWSIEQAKSSAEELESRGDPIICAEAGLIVRGSCQDFRSLELNITNTNNRELEGISIRLIGLYPEDVNSLETSTQYQKISSGYTEKIIVIKKGTLSQIKVIPVVKNNNRYLICEDKSVTKDMGELKQC